MVSGTVQLPALYIKKMSSTNKLSTAQDPDTVFSASFPVTIEGDRILYTNNPAQMGAVIHELEEHAKRTGMNECLVQNRGVLVRGKMAVESVLCVVSRRPGFPRWETR